MATYVLWYTPPVRGTVLILAKSRKEKQNGGLALFR
jgi:hypothetical protein